MTINVAVDDGFELDGWVRNWPPAARDGLRTASEAYKRVDLGAMVNLLDEWALEFDPCPGSPFASWAGLLAAVALRCGKVALPPGGVTVLDDPENGAPTEGSAAWWAAGLADCRGRHRTGLAVIGGHGYRKPWEDDTFNVPAGTTLIFYVPDGVGLAETLAVALADTGVGGDQMRLHLAVLERTLEEDGARELNLPVRALRFRRTYREGDPVYNYTVTPPKQTDQAMAAALTVASRRKLADLVKPDLGELHLGFCREVDWWAGFRGMPGADIHHRPQGWRYVIRHAYEGYEGPDDRHPPEIPSPI